MPSRSLVSSTKTVTFYGNRTLLVPAQRLTLIQREFCHEVCSVLIETETDAASRYDTKTPISIDWGLSGKVSTFYGYVHHSQPIAVAGQRAENKLKLICVGATYPLDDEAQRVWRNVTVSQVAREILDDVKLSGHVADHPQGWSTLSQAGESSWNYLASLAQKVGWTMAPVNTDVHFHDPLWNIMRMKQTAAQYTFGSKIPEQQILVFSPVSGETTPGFGAKANRTIYGIDPMSVKPFATTVGGINAYGLGDVYADPVVSSFSSASAAGVAEAGSILVGEAKKNRWYIQARAEVSGSTRLRPGVLVSIDGINPRHNGYWYVLAVEHEVTGDGMTDHLVLGRDSEWDQNFRPDPRGRRVLSPRLDPYGQQQVTVPPTLLVNKVWRAAFSPRPFNAG
jgi:hypothetical protein